MSDLVELSDLLPRGQKTQRYVSYSGSYWKRRKSKRLSFYSVLTAPSAIEPENLAVIIGIRHNSRKDETLGVIIAEDSSNVVVWSEYFNDISTLSNELLNSVLMAVAKENTISVVRENGYSSCKRNAEE